MPLPARPPAIAPAAAPIAVPTGPATEPAAAPAAIPPAAAPSPVPTGCEPGAPEIGSRLASVPSFLLVVMVFSKSVRAEFQFESMPRRRKWRRRHRARPDRLHEEFIKALSVPYRTDRRPKGGDHPLFD